MKQEHIWKLILILFVLGWAVYELIPLQNRDIVEEFKRRAVVRDAAFSNILARVDELGKEVPARRFGNLKEAVGTNDLAKYFPFIDAKGQKNPSSFILNRLQKEALGKVRLGLDLQGGTEFLVGMDTSKLSTNDTDRSAAISQAVEVLRKRVDKYGVAEPIIQPQGEDRISIQMPGLSDAEKDNVRQIIQKAAYLEFRMVHPDSAQLVAQDIIEPGYVLMKEERRDPKTGKTDLLAYLVSKKPERGLDGKYLTRAYVTRHHITGEPQIAFEFNTEGATIFADITREYSPKNGRFHQLAIVLDGELESAPRINGEIPGGSGVIEGNFDFKSAQDLANVLENPLQAPVKILSETSVDPSLGKDSIQSGLLAAGIGTLAVAGFMIAYYLLGGMIAVFAMLLNSVILLGVMCSVGTTLTLPGIAGIVLTIGMAVDANVLIFERIREELATGKSLRGALAAGYDKAFSTIFDSHLTTLISSVILIFMGTGPVKGFGVTLTIGVALSLFTALVVTRLIFDWLLAKEWLKSLPMLHLVRHTNIDFMRWAKMAFVASWLLIFIGNGYGIFGRGKDVLGYEFVGGESMAIAYTNKVSTDKLRAVIGKLAIGDVMIQYQEDPVTKKGVLRVTTREVEKIGKSEGASTAVLNALQKEFPEAGFNPVGSSRVGPTVGKEIQKNAIIASLLAMFGILVYIAFRYEFSFAVGAVVAIIHDILMTLGWYFLSGRELNGTMVAAILTIIGFSINDTVVIFDRIREDLRLGVRGSFLELINKALNQTLSRTVITSGTVLLATLSLYIFGGGVINDFAFTFLVGILTGTYSSIYIASALVLWWHKGERPKTGMTVSLDNAA